MTNPLGQTIVQVIIGGGIVFAIGIWLGSLGAHCRLAVAIYNKSTATRVTTVKSTIA